MKTLIAVIVTTLAIYAGVCCGQNYIAEVFIAVDKKAVDRFVSEIPGTGSYATKVEQAKQTINNDLTYILAKTNILLSSLNMFMLRSEIRIRAIQILDYDVFTPNIIQQNIYVSGTSGLQAFSDWLVSQNTFNTHHYDFGLYLTGYDLTGDLDKYTAGIANIGHICNNKTGVTVVEFKGTYQTAIIIAHEFAHLAGANHDGIASEKIMAISTNPNYKYRWNFDECTAKHIKEYMPQLSPNCMLTTNATSVLPTFNLNSYTGQMLNRDVICQRTLNLTESYMCFDNVLYNNKTAKGDEVCSTFYCNWPGRIYCYQAFTSDGMICDRYKRCENGRCVPDISSGSANVDATCPLGDQKVLDLPSVNFYGTCAKLIASNTSAVCYIDYIQQVCCASCKSVKTSTLGCEYGDRSSQCSNYTQALVCPTYGQSLCCRHCHGYRAKRFAAGNRKSSIILTPVTLPRDTQGWAHATNSGEADKIARSGD